MVRDIFRGIEHWLVDEGLESSACDKSVLATQLYTPDHFCMAAGVFVPVNLDLIVEALESAPHLMPIIRRILPALLRRPGCARASGL
jgi:hypothetical protein